MDDDMRLPVGKVCLDCAFYNRCKWLFGCEPNSTECDWATSRFIPKEETKVITDIQLKADASQISSVSHITYCRIDDLGRVAIPKNYRQILGIQEGDELEIQLLPRGVLITQKQQEDVREREDKG